VNPRKILEKFCMHTTCIFDARNPLNLTRGANHQSNKNPVTPVTKMMVFRNNLQIMYRPICT